MNSAKNISDRVKEANIQLHDRDADIYDEKNPAHYEYVTQHRIAEVLEIIRKESGDGRLLDAGCGTGNILGAAKGLFRQRAGFDISLEMCRIARQKSTDVACADFDFIPFANEIFDGVAAFSVAHHLYQQDRLFKEVFRVLKKGGFFYADYDPNFFNRNTRSGRAYASFYRWLMKIKNVKSSGESFLEEGEGYGKGELSLAELAEYGRSVQRGLNPVTVKKQLLNIGFREVKIFYHDDFSSLSFRREKRWKFRMLMKVWSLLMLKSNCDFLPYFLTLAKK